MNNPIELVSAKEVESFYVQNGLNRDFCLAPFTTLLLEPDGRVGACRHKGAEFPVGNILHQNFDEIWNGDFLKKWRAEFLDGKPMICADEVKFRKCNSCPSYSKLFPKAQVSVHQLKKPSRIAFNFNGHCNLECNMCHIWQKENGLYDKINFWDQFSGWIEDLEEVELLSGEPFIQKDTYKLIDLISENKPDAYWTITTNANWILTDFIKNKLDKIKVKNIIISLDCVTEKFYKEIRKKGNFYKALTTLRALKEYEIARFDAGLSRLNIKVNFLIQKINWTDLALVEEFSKVEKVDIFRTFLYEPADLSLLTLDESKRVHVLDWYFENMCISSLKSSMRVIRPLLDSLSPINKIYFYEKFYSGLKLTD